MNPRFMRFRELTALAALGASIWFAPPATASLSTAAPQPKENGLILFEAWGPCWALPEPKCQSTANPVYDLWAVAPDGSGLTNVTKTPGVDTDAAWSPDGQDVVFASNRKGSYDIFLMDPLGTNVREVVVGRGNQTYPTWSPDGRRIAYVSNIHRANDILLMRRDGSGKRRVASFLVDQLFALVWSPDGRWLAFAKSDPEGMINIFLIRPDGTGLRRLTDRRVWGESPSWSPDSRRLTFVGGPCTGEECGWHIWTVGRDGTNLSRVVEVEAGADEWVDTPEWSPDGKQIVYLYSKDDHVSYGDLWTVNVDGSDKDRLLAKPDSYDYAPAWQPLP